MTEEEKKAIDKLKSWKSYMEKDEDEMEVIDTISNLIEKLQKENKDLRKLTEFQKEYINKLEQDLFENCSNFVIPKDKIRELLEEHNIELAEDTIAMSKQGAFAFMLSIKELLEEEQE